MTEVSRLLDTAHATENDSIFISRNDAVEFQSLITWKNVSGNSVMSFVWNRSSDNLKSNNI